MHGVRVNRTKASKARTIWGQRHHDNDLSTLNPTTDHGSYGGIPTLLDPQAFEKEASPRGRGGHRAHARRPWIRIVPTTSSFATSPPTAANMTWKSLRTTNDQPNWTSEMLPPVSEVYKPTSPLSNSLPRNCLSRALSGRCPCHSVFVRVSGLRLAPLNFGIYKGGPSSCIHRVPSNSERLSYPSDGLPTIAGPFRECKTHCHDYAFEGELRTEDDTGAGFDVPVFWGEGS